MKSKSKSQTSGEMPLDGAEPHTGHLTAPLAFASYAVCCLTFIVAVTRVHNFWEMSSQWADNPKYLTIAQEAVKGRFAGPALEDVRQYYRGAGYCIALVSKITTLPPAACLPLMSLACGALSVYFCGRLWGWRAATLFAFINIALTQPECLGGSEPFFVVFLFASLWLWRQGHALSAVAIACLATSVRPTGVFLLLALVGVLAWHRRWRDVLKSVLITAILGALYVAPLIFMAKDPLGPVNGYAGDWYGPFPVTLPFYPLIRTALLPGTPWIRHVKIWLFLAFTLFGLVTLWKRRRRAFADATSQAEWIFFLLFAGFCVSYNSYYGYDEYPRFSSPIVPQSLVDLRSRLLRPSVILPMSVVAGLLSAASALNVRTVYHMLFH
jgi:hypothetical protein